MNIRFFSLLGVVIPIATSIQCNHTNNSLLQIYGDFRDTLTLEHNISPTTWKVIYPGVGTCERTLLDFKDTEGFAIYSEQGTACLHVGKFGKIFFAGDSAGVPWYCDFITGKSSADEVRAISSSPDATSLATTGCNGTAWIKMNAASADFSLVGSFSDNFGGSQVFTNTLWTTSYGTPCTFAIIFYDNTNGYFIYQQQADNGCFSTNNYKFGKVFWGVDSTAKLYYCELLYGQASYLTVANSATKPDYSSPSTTGCSGFSWTHISR